MQIQRAHRRVFSQLTFTPFDPEYVAPRSEAAKRAFHAIPGTKPKKREPLSASMHSPADSGASHALRELRPHETLGSLLGTSVQATKASFFLVLARQR